jgi:hypothetical protein
VSANGGNSNKCGNKNGFNIQSYIYNAQLGAELTYQFTGAFYACGNDQAVRFPFPSSLFASLCPDSPSLSFFSTASVLTAPTDLL